MQTTRTLSYSEYTLPTSTGDEFTGDMIDRTIWADLEFVREIVNQKLVSEVRAPNTSDSTGYTYRWANNSLNFPYPEEVNSIQAEVSVLRIIHTNPTGGTRAMLTGRWYNDGTSGGGDIWAAVLLGATPAGGLQARWEVYRFTNPEGTTWEFIKDGNFATSVTFGESYTLYISYDSGLNQFTFKIGNETKTFGRWGWPSSLGMEMLIPHLKASGRGFGSRVPPNQDISQRPSIMCIKNGVMIMTISMTRQA